MSDNNYPRVLYRAGTQEDAHGFMVDLHFVDSADAEKVAKAEGWVMTPAETADAAPAPLTILDNPVADIVAALPDLTGEELQALLAAETAGKARKSLVKALEAAIAERADAPVDDAVDADTVDTPKADA